MKILHLSDIHVCDENKDQLPILCNGVIMALNSYADEHGKPDVVLITGDYTHRGTIDELTLFKRNFIRMLENPVFSNIKYIILVPGNHDYPWGSEDESRDTNFNEFVRDVGKVSKIDDCCLDQRIKQESISHMYEEYDAYRVLLIGMNSMKIDSEERKGIGYFDSKQLELVADLVKHYRAKSIKVLYTFVAFHHHLLPVSFVERDTLEDAQKYSLTLDARRAIDTFLDSDISFALHGHQHQPSMFTIIDDSGKHNDKNLHIIASGCLADRNRLNDSGRKSFFLYDISEGCMKAVMAETTRDDSDRFEWKPPRIYSLAVSSLPKINKDRILNLAEKDNRWVRRVDEGQSAGEDTVSIEDLMKMLVDGIADDGSVSYYAGKKMRYRTSTLATVLECMADIKLLPKEDLLVMQRKLMRLRDSAEEVIKTCEQDDVIEKAPEDMPAWGIDEAPSVWTTSKALTALFITEYTPNSDDEVTKLRESVLWLANQQYSSGGWGYQNYQESAVCQSSIPMTALALRALSLATQQNYLKVEENETHARIVYNAIKKGVKYLLDKNVKDDDVAYWKYMDKPNLSASVWAHQALKDAEHQLRLYDSIFGGYAGNKLIKRINRIEQLVLDYVVMHLPSEDSAEALTETFFHAPIGSTLKYKGEIVRKKDFKSFTPFVLSYLLKADPEYAERDEVKAMLKWVLNHKDTQWLLDDFNGESGDPCMISIAMSINIIVNWLQVISNVALDKAISALMGEA